MAATVGLAAPVHPCSVQLAARSPIPRRALRVARHKDDVARYLEAYVAHFALPVRLNTRVSSMVKDADRFVVMTDGDTFTARSVIVATGAYHRPYIPAFASDFLPSLVQRHSSEYRNPGALPSGSVLVVGAGNSGAQIALELADSGRSTWLSGRDTGSIPRRLLGRDVYDWLWWTVMRPSIDSWVGRRLMGDGLFTGDPLVGFSRRALMVPTLTTVGRTVGASNGPPRLEDGRVLEDVRTVVWCTGFRPDFRWIQLPVFGSEGYPHHRRGIVAGAPGLGFVGLRYHTGSARRCSAVCARMPSTSSGSCPRTIRTPRTLITETKRPSGIRTLR